MLMDPLLHLMIAFPLAVLLLSAAEQKVSDGARFRAQLQAYELLPAGVLPAATRVLPAAELAVGVALLVPAASSLAGLAAAALLTIYAVAMLTNLLRGRSSIDCGCGGTPQPLSLWLILRNLALAGAAALLLLPTGARPLSWADAFAILLTTALLALCYLTLQQILGNRAALGGWNAHDA